MASYKQIYQTVNKINKMAWGTDAISVVDATGLVATGDKVISSTADTDIWTKKMFDVLSDQIIANRKRESSFLSNIYRTTEEYGMAIEKIIVKVPDAKLESQWELQDGQELKNPTAAFPQVEVEIFESRNVYRFDITFPIDQLKSAFLNAGKMGAFLAAMSLELSNKIESTATNVARLCVNNFIAEKYDWAKKHVGDGVQAINVLEVYNKENNKTLKAKDALKDPDFIRQANMIQSKYIDRMGDDSTVFNIKHINRQTKGEYLNYVVLSDYVKASEAYLESNTFHDSYVALGKSFQKVNFWQGTGKTYALEDVAKIEMTTSSGTSVVIPYVLGFAFDKDALGVNWEYQKSRSFYSAEYDANHQIHSIGTGFFNDYNYENGIVFYMEDAPGK